MIHERKKDIIGTVVDGSKQDMCKVEEETSSEAEEGGNIMEAHKIKELIHEPEGEVLLVAVDDEPEKVILLAAERYTQYPMQYLFQSSIIYTTL